MTNLPAAVLARGLVDTPDKIAFALFGPARAERWSYARLHSATAAVATKLTAIGWAKGSVAITRGHGSDAIVATLAALAAGFTPIIAQADTLPDGIVGVIGDAEAAPSIPRTTLAEWIDSAAPDAALPDAEPAQRIGFAQSNGAVNWHDAATLLNRANAFAAEADLSATDRLMWAGRVDGEMTFTLGLIATLQAGGTILLPAAGLQVATLALLMKRHDATIFAAPAHVLDIVARQPITTLPRLRHGVNWGAPLPDDLAALWQDKTGTPLRDIAPPASPDDKAAFAVAALADIREATTLRDDTGLTIIYDGDIPATKISAGPFPPGRLWQFGGPLPRDADGRIDHHSLINAMESAR